MKHTDIKSEHWTLRYLPDEAKPYGLLARLDRPAGISLLLLPAWWSIMLASGGVMNVNSSDLYILVLFLGGAVVMRAAGCVINDLWDRDLDKGVERTKGRPLASGLVTPKQAMLFLGGLLLCGFWVLMQLSTVAILLGFLTIPLIILYPLMKRWTWWPQLFLGFTFNSGALIGWASITGIVELPALLLYIGGIFWTLAYDTIYAHQDKEDDVLMGIKSAALKLGDKSKKWITVFYVAAFFFIGCGFLLGGQGILSFLLLASPVAHVIMWLWTWDETSPQSSLAFFKANMITGALIFLCACF